MMEPSCEVESERPPAPCARRSAIPIPGASAAAICRWRPVGRRDRGPRGCQGAESALGANSVTEKIFARIASKLLPHMLTHAARSAAVDLNLVRTPYGLTAPSQPRIGGRRVPRCAAQRERPLSSRAAPTAPAVAPTSRATARVRRSRARALLGSQQPSVSRTRREVVEVEKSTFWSSSKNGHHCARRVGAVNAATEKRERARDSTRNAFCELVLVTARRQQGEVQK